MLLVADLLSVIVSSSRGRQHLLYGETQERFTKSKYVALLTARFMEHQYYPEQPQSSLDRPGD